MSEAELDAEALVAGDDQACNETQDTVDEEFNPPEYTIPKPRPLSDFFVMKEKEDESMKKYIDEMLPEKDTVVCK